MKMTLMQRTRTITKVTRGPQSRNGNPSYIFHVAFDDGRIGEEWAKTETDSSLGYSLPNDFPINEDIERVVMFTIDFRSRQLKSGLRTYRNVRDYEVIEVRK